jgi:DNA-binding LytR/AlgR family response regulator
VRADMTTALIADDEPLLREALIGLLVQAWPELEIVAQARNGREAIELFGLKKPEVCFLDIRMPGISGIEAARQIGRRTHIVFVTAFDHFAIQAFETGALDYLVKPVELARLYETVERLKDRIAMASRAINSETLIEELNRQLQDFSQPEYLSWLRVRIGVKVRVIAVDDIDFFQSEDKYTLFSWHNQTETYSEGLVRTPIKALMPQLDPKKFARIHRSAIVKLASISHVIRGKNDTGTLYLKDSDKTLPVSRAHLSQFRAML